MNHDDALIAEKKAKIDHDPAHGWYVWRVSAGSEEYLNHDGVWRRSCVDGWYEEYLDALAVLKSAGKEQG